MSVVSAAEELRVYARTSSDLDLRAKSLLAADHIDTLEARIKRTDAEFNKQCLTIDTLECKIAFELEQVKIAVVRIQALEARVKELERALIEITDCTEAMCIYLGEDVVNWEGGRGPRPRRPQAGGGVMKRPLTEARLAEMEARGAMAESVSLPIADFFNLIAAARNGLRPQLAATTQHKGPTDER